MKEKLITVFGKILQNAATYTELKLAERLADAALDEVAVELEQLRAELDEARERNDKMEAALEAISAWTIAYPLAVFPEPDFKRVRVLLEAGGITLDSVSASSMRHVIEGVKKIVDDGLEANKETK